ncbi:MAG: 30S ribosomal protein S21 [Candidatus Yanofskybacteria bacterium]|nr:30S ribosomal protein S21 [Candidatus Yanofskybacteria bacterium]
MDVKRKPNETIGSMMRRFSKVVQQSRVLPQVKESRFYKKKKSERQNKNRAIMREELKALRKRLERLGKYSEETFDEEKRRIKQKLDL